MKVCPEAEVAVTVACGITAPVGSVTDPRMPPVPVGFSPWAAAVWAWRRDTATGPASAAQDEAVETDNKAKDRAKNESENGAGIK